jgi:hypothetical protein
VAYSTGIISGTCFNFHSHLRGPKITYRGFTTSKGWGSTDPDYKVKFEEFKTLFNAGKARETAPGEYAATLANGEEFRFKGDPNTLSITKDEEETWKRMVDEAIDRKERGIYEKVYYPRWMQEAMGGMPSPSGRFIMERYVLSGGKIFIPGTGEATRKNEQAFAEIEKLRKEGKFVKVYRPIDSFLKESGIIRYDVPRIGYGEKYRYCESTYLVSDGRLFTIGEYEPAPASEAAFQEIEKLRAAGQCKKTYRPQYDLMLKDGWHHYVEAAYTLANGQEFRRVEYEPKQN